MKFIISFTYLDGEKFDTEVAEGDMEGFIGALSASEVFFNKFSGEGIFIPMDKIRYFNVERVDEQGRRVVASNSVIPYDNGSVESRPLGDRVEGKGSVAGVILTSESKSKSSKKNDGTVG